MADNYVRVWTQLGFPRIFANTAYLTIVITLLQIVTCSLAAYAFAKIKFRFRDAIFFGYLGTMMVPYQVLMIPQFIIIRSLDLTDTFTALILIGSFSPFGVFLLRQYYLSIPMELSEAARIDGFNDFGIYTNYSAYVQACYCFSVHIYHCWYME